MASKSQIVLIPTCTYFTLSSIGCGSCSSEKCNGPHTTPGTNWVKKTILLFKQTLYSFECIYDNGVMIILQLNNFQTGRSYTINKHFYQENTITFDSCRVCFGPTTDRACINPKHCVISVFMQNEAFNQLLNDIICGINLKPILSHTRDTRNLTEYRSPIERDIRNPTEYRNPIEQPAKKYRLELTHNDAADSFSSQCDFIPVKEVESTNLYADFEGESMPPSKEITKDLITQIKEITQRDARNPQEITQRDTRNPQETTSDLTKETTPDLTKQKGCYRQALYQFRRDIYLPCNMVNCAYSHDDPIKNWIELIIIYKDYRIKVKNWAQCCAVIGFTSLRTGRSVNGNLGICKVGPMDNQPDYNHSMHCRGSCDYNRCLVLHAMKQYKFRDMLCDIFDKF